MFKLRSAIIIGLIVIGGVVLGLSSGKSVRQPPQQEKGAVLSFQNQFKEKMTAFDLLKERAGESGLALKTKTYDIGILIEAIGEKKNGDGGFYWMYYVNGELPMVAADKYELKPGDKVEFKFEKSTF